MTQTRNLTHDFIRRTLANLASIEKNASISPNDFFEVTQLINSCVGLLFVPTENQVSRLQDVGIADFLVGITPPRLLYGNLKYENAAGLVRYLRNAFAHLNFEFQNWNNQIAGVYVWNENESRTIDWVAYIPVSDLREMLLRISKHYLTQIKFDEPTEGRIDEVTRKTGANIRITNPSSI